MAKMSKRTKRAAERAAATVTAASQAATRVAPCVVVDQERRRSGASGAHAKSSVHRSDAAGRKTRVGSRSTQRRAHIRDWS